MAKSRCGLQAAAYRGKLSAVFSGSRLFRCEGLPGRRTDSLRCGGHEELGTEFVSLEKYAKDAAEYLSAQGIRRADAMYGVSMGGATVIRFLVCQICEKIFERMKANGIVQEICESNTEAGRFSRKNDA
jgi:hypothetical protein